MKSKICLKNKIKIYQTTDRLTEDYVCKKVPYKILHYDISFGRMLTSCVKGRGLHIRPGTDRDIKIVRFAKNLELRKESP